MISVVFSQCFLSTRRVLNFLFVSAIFAKILVCSEAAVHRKLSYQVNPTCEPTHCFPEKNKPPINLVHIEAKGVNDTVHYLWSTYRLPTVLIVRTEINATLTIDWENLQNLQYPAFKFSEKPLQSVGFAINELWEFVDKSDVVDMHKAASIYSLNLTDFVWDNIGNSTKSSEAFISAASQSYSDENVFQDNGTFGIQFSVSATAESSADYPHLWFTGVSSQMRLLLQNLVSSDKKSRFAAEVLSFSSSFHNENWTQDFSVSINDEYSPGVFKTQYLYSKSPLLSNVKSFLTWKPVAYIGVKPTVANSSDATSSPYQYSSVISPNSIAAAFYGHDDHVALFYWNMTFGTSGDGFYGKTGFTSWSIMLGLDDPISDKMSLLAIVVISVGLGLPALMMIAGGGYMGYKKWKSKQDDLLLEG